MRELVGILHGWALLSLLVGGLFLWSFRGTRLGKGPLWCGLFCWSVGGYDLACALHYAATNVVSAERAVFARGIFAGVMSVVLAEFLWSLAPVQENRWNWLMRRAPSVTGILVGTLLTWGYLQHRWSVVALDRTLWGSTSVVYSQQFSPGFALLFQLSAAALSLSMALLARHVWKHAPHYRALCWGAFGMCVFGAIDALPGASPPTLLEHAAFAYSLFVALFITRRLADTLAERTAELHQKEATLQSVREALQRKEQLAAVGELSAIVAHEIRNPLGVLTTAAASLRKSELAPADRTLLLGIVEEETQRLNHIVTDLLQLAKPISPQWRPTELLEVIDKALEPARQCATDITVESSTDARELFSCDGMLLRQALQNLIENAVQAMGPGGILLVHITIVQKEGKPGREIAITDSGEGMNTEVRGRAKEPFFTTRPTGTGLGLAIVDRIVRAHGGMMEIESKRSLGTTVRVWLPETKHDADISGRSKPVEAR